MKNCHACKSESSGNNNRGQRTPTATKKAQGRKQSTGMAVVSTESSIEATTDSQYENPYHENPLDLVFRFRYVVIK